MTATTPPIPGPVIGPVSAAARRRGAGSRRFLGRLYRMPTAIIGTLILAVTIVLALCAPLFIGDRQLDVARATGPQDGAPSSHYLLGTDHDGRSILTLVVWGARASLYVGVIAALLALVLGTLVGMLAGHYGGLIGRGLMMVTDWFIALPSLPLAIALSAAIGQGDKAITVAIAVTSWTATARLVRAQTLAVEARPFIERARALGAGNRQIMTRHVLPNVAPIVLVSGTLTIASAILSETTLTFLGLGNPLEVSWGSMLNETFQHSGIIGNYWWEILTPGIAILIVVLGFTMVGRAVEAVLNPRTGRT
jgi:peptide/nickel transport system permease protein